MVDVTVSEPLPIFKVADNYILYDVNAVTHVRREHHMCGILIGNLPQAMQQNIYSGIPLVLMPEEARLLVEQGHAYIIDDVAAHKNGLKDLKEQDRLAYIQTLEKDGLDAAAAQQQVAKASKTRFLARSQNPRPLPQTPSSASSPRVGSSPRDEALFESSIQRRPSPLTSRSLEPMHITPTTSYPPLSAEPPQTPLPLPEVPSSYPLYAHLQSKGYYISPGLRFGCQYLAYPGDPLRFHSHFLAVGMGWDDEIDLLDIVAGGRLGTGVKKGYLIGGRKEEGYGEEEEEVRAFSFEWAVM